MNIRFNCLADGQTQTVSRQFQNYEMIFKSFFYNIVFFKIMEKSGILTDQILGAFGPKLKAENTKN